MSPQPSQSERYIAMSWALGRIHGLVATAITYLNETQHNAQIAYAMDRLEEINTLCAVRGDVLVEMQRKAQGLSTDAGGGRRD
jgi:hypothetical protein